MAREAFIFKESALLSLRALLVDVDICGCYAAAAAIQRAEEGATGRETQRQRGVPPERRGGAHAGQDGAREKWCWCGGSKEGVGHKEGGGG